MGVTYGFLSGQPLTILGSTGPILVFETIMFDFCKSVGFQYLPFRFWDAIQLCREIRFITVVIQLNRIFGGSLMQSKGKKNNSRRR